MYYSVDAIEGNIARLVDDEETAFSVPLSELPPGTAQGDVVERREDVWLAAPEETRRRREYAASLLRHLLER